ncbi:MAG: ComEC/Rec2 family competence protein [Armatimonadetes bacterium]|nr:ComEC/Rec2 family competence protein [Armatimonadota bacterium]
MRDEFENRPLLLVFAGLCVGAAAAWSPWNVLFVLPLTLLPKAHWKRALPLFAAGVAWWLSPPMNLATEVREEQIAVNASVLTMPRDTAVGMSAVIEADGVRYWARFPLGSDVALGDRLRVVGEVSPLNEGQGRLRGASRRLKVDSFERIRSGLPFWRAGLWVRHSFRRFIGSAAGERSGNIIDSVCFSATDELTPEFWRSLRATGTAHIVSTSGLHVIVTALGLMFLLGRTRVPRVWQLAILTVCLLIYAGAAGMRPPILRAVITAVILATAYLWRRPIDGLSALSAAGIVALLIAPEMALNVGFQLSTAAVLSLVLFMPREFDAEPTSMLHVLRQWGVGVVKSSFIVTLAVSPLLAYHFGEIPVVGVLANLLTVPLLGVIVCGSLLCWGISLVFPALADGMLAVAVEPFVGWVVATIETLGRIPYASVFVPAMSAYWLPFIYVGLALIWKPYVRSS